MSNRSIIRRNDPLTRAAKATAEERRVQQQRREEMASGKLGRDYGERRERLAEQRAKLRQLRADRIGATQDLINGG